MGKRCQVCDGPIVNGRCKYCGMPYRNDAVMYHLNEDRSEHYRHSSAKVRREMDQSEIPLPDRKGGADYTKKKNAGNTSKTVNNAGRTASKTYTSGKQSGTQEKKKGKKMVIFWLVIALLAALIECVPDALETLKSHQIEEFIYKTKLIDKDDKEKKEVPDQKVMSSSELDKYAYYMLNTEDSYYEVVESNTEDFMGPGEYVVEAVWEGIELELIPADGTGGEIWDFNQEGQQLKLELHKGDKLTVTSLDGQYNYFRLYEIQQYDE
ncbi:hypothetical protein ACTNDS_03750 [Blautia sp. HCP3S3_C12]|uniref:hypothetical protein n=1 Tax=unclassified Blautia TaxID=2648079 RepID=UPI003F8CD442|nr:hypothetical protein [Ruminococcus sp.]